MWVYENNDRKSGPYWSLGFIFEGPPFDPRVTALIFAIALVAAWWLTIRPSNTRDWQPDVAQTPVRGLQDKVAILTGAGSGIGRATTADLGFVKVQTASDTLVINRRGFAFCVKPVQRRAFVTRMLPRSST